MCSRTTNETEKVPKLTIKSYSLVASRKGDSPALAQAEGKAGYRCVAFQSRPPDHGTHEHTLETIDIRLESADQLSLDSHWLSI
jgi:hypothetical protein